MYLSFLYLRSRLPGNDVEMHRWILICLIIGLQVRILPPYSPMVVMAPGNDATLPCSFSPSEQLSLSSLIINWQHGDTVVHSFYHAKDQLERQGQTYKNRTHLFTDQILSGNASLSLSNVQVEDHGEYTCYVSSAKETSRGTIMLTVAAPFDEPELSLQPTCDGINITATFSNGFPQPEVRWFNSFGGVINEIHYLSQLDSRGRYEVSSTISFRSSTIERVTLEMTLKVIDQSFTRSLHLHPLLDACQECCQNACVSQTRTLVTLVVILILFGLCVLLMVIIKKHKQSQEQR